MIYDRLKRGNPMFGLSAGLAVGGNKGSGDPRLGQYFRVSHDCLMNIATGGANCLDGTNHQ